MLRNIVELVEGEPARMHFAAAGVTERQITDPVLQVDKTVRTLLLLVDELNGEPASATFSVVAEKLAAQLEPWLEGERFKDAVFTITKRGSGFGTRYEVTTAPRR